MTKVFRVLLGLLLLIALVSFLACEGDQGPQGPPGDPGDPGDPGANASTDPPGDMLFGLALANASDYSQNGNHRIHLTFNQSASPSESVVVCFELDKPPVLDGEDNGAEEWGAGSSGLSSIPLENVRGLDSRIDMAYMRAGYDDRYVYMMIQWEEKNVDSTDADSTFALFTATASWNPNYWRYDPSYTGVVRFTFRYLAKWRPETAGEDQVLLFWRIAGATDWNGDGSALVYHDTDSNLYLSGDGSVDLWHWRAGRTGHLGFFDDEYITSAGMVPDQGTPAFSPNQSDLIRTQVFTDTTRSPLYMHRLDPQYSAEPPLWSYETVPFVASPASTKPWKENNTIPGFISIPPLGGRADIECSMSSKSWEAGSQFWTVELRRLRKTGHGDDVQF